MWGSRWVVGEGDGKRMGSRFGKGDMRVAEITLL
jgi:hypothetical protein